MSERSTFLNRVPDAERLARAYEDALWWSADVDPSVRAELMRSVGEELVVLRLLEREMNELRQATETRWDGRSSAFLQADSIAEHDRDDYIESLRRLAELMDQVRAAGRVRAPSGSPKDPGTPAATE